MADPARARSLQKYFKEEVVALGLDSATVRAYVRDKTPDLKNSLRIQDAIGFCDRLLREPELEIRGVGILVLGLFAKDFTIDLLPAAKRWLATRLDNWALVDSFCSIVLSRLLEREPTVQVTLRAWSRHPVLWVRRASIVTLVPFARRGVHLDLSYELAREHFGDPEDLMHKAVGWLLREAGKTDMPRLRRFLLAQGPDTPRTALRYAIERFPPPERAKLLAATRPPATPTQSPPANLTPTPRKPRSRPTRRPAL
jgi:3-methyladenine DNA glycosylase AlkD